MSIKPDNAVILAAGFASRFTPVSLETPKSLVPVKGEILLERQIRQLQEAGISEIIVVTGYRHEQFRYLKDKYGVILVHNPEYLSRNNHSSIYAARDYLGNSYVCSSDNYFTQNVFLEAPEHPYYAAVYASGDTSEWCIQAADDGHIDKVTIGGRDSWYMLGHTFWDQAFSRKMLSIIKEEYDSVQIRGDLWENVYIRHLPELDMYIRPYPDGVIREFDSVDELSAFDPDFKRTVDSALLKELSETLHCPPEELNSFVPLSRSFNRPEFSFAANGFHYFYINGKLEKK